MAISQTPWKVHGPTCLGDFTVHYRDTCSLDNQVAHVGREGDARLIAAAPRMLDALLKAEAILRAYIPDDKYDGHCAATLTAVTEAIADAHGMLVTLKRRDA